MQDDITLFWSFFQIGLFTFGGGYAMLPMLEREVVTRHAWVTQEELLDCFALAQCTPGVIAVNTATYVGYQRKGILGGIIATFGVVLPSILVISLIASVLRQFSEVQIVRHAFSGIRIAVAVLVVQALGRLFRNGVKGALGCGIFAAALLLSILTELSPAILVLAAILLSFLLRKVGKAS